MFLNFKSPEEQEALICNSKEDGNDSEQFYGTTLSLQRNVSLEPSRSLSAPVSVSAFVSERSLSEQTENNNYLSDTTATSVLQLALNKDEWVTKNNSTASTHTVASNDTPFHHPNQDHIANLFSRSKSYLRSNHYPKTMPVVPPEKRGTRHRAPNFRRLNNLRHWWKSSRLLVRIAGAIVLLSLYKWDKIIPNLQAHNVPPTRTGLKRAVKAMKAIGRGGYNRSFLQNVHPLTRTVRLYMAVMRGSEARVDDRFWEVLIAEAMAFMGNRSLRWWARHFVDWSSRFCVFPVVMAFVNEDSRYGALVWKYMIFIMGLCRAFLPFMSSFVGSRIGRSTAFAASDRLNHRWKPVQFVEDFVVSAGTYRPTIDDPILVVQMNNIATAIGDGKDPSRVRIKLREIGFEMVGAGAGGYSFFRLFPHENQRTELKLHVTPYGPSILEEMPRYIVLERKTVDALSCNLSNNVSTSATTLTDKVVKGFSYSGAFFTFQEWAALKVRHDNEHLRYNNACKYMSSKSNMVFAMNHNSPPSDLVSLKTFIRTGLVYKKKKRDEAQWSQVMKQLDVLSNKILKMKSKGVAPKGVIIYIEGLDCAGKSSTSGLIMQALERAGYDISQIQYNKPPTSEERSKPWMWRFKRPSATDGACRNTALVWDRGPAGDFVYGALNGLSEDMKLQRFIEFHKFEEECKESGILFCKLMFVTSKDAVAKTLGKRLAHKQIVRDLHTWFDANSMAHSERKGLDEIENHIDPTDFIAFNKYDLNKRIFHEFVVSTDHISRLHMNSNRIVYNYFPWLIINTSERHIARTHIIGSFEKELDHFERSTKRQLVNPPVNPAPESEELERLLFSDIERQIKSRILWSDVMLFVLHVMVMLVIAGSYLHQTWKIG